MKKFILLIFFASAVITFPCAFAMEDANQAYEKALIAFQNEEISSSVIHLKNALKLDVTHMPSRVLLAQVLIEQGNGVAAEVELNKAREGRVDEDRLVTLYAKAFLLQNRFDESLSVASAGNRGTDIELKLLVISGQAYIGKNQYPLADKAFISALSFAPKNQLALLGRAQVLLKNGRLTEALTFTDASVSSAIPFINGWILKASILQKLNRSTDAMAAIDQALIIDDKHLLARLSKAMILIGNEDYLEAQVHIGYILNEIPNEPRARYLNAIINANVNTNDNPQGKIAEIVVTLSAVPNEIMKTAPDYYYLAGLTNYQLSNFNEARRFLIKYLKYSEYDINSVRMIAAIDLQQGELNTALRLLTKTNFAKPENPNVLMLLGMTYSQLKDNNKAQYYFEKLLKKFPESELSITNYARGKMQSGDYQAAIDTLLEIKGNNINSTQIKLLLIDSYQKTKRYDQAILIAKNLVEQFPENSFFHQRLGSLYGLNGELDSARKAFNQSLLLDGANVFAIIHLARMDHISGESDKAILLLQNQLNKFPDNILLMAELSDAYLIKADRVNALLWINKAYAQSPNDFDVLVKLTNVLVENEKIEEAIELVDAFIGNNSKNSSGLLLIASLFQKANKHQQAVLSLSYYVDKASNKALALVHLAKAQIKANDTPSAIKTYKKALIFDDQLLSAQLGLVNLIIDNKDEKYALIIIDDISQLTKSKSLVETLLGDLYLNLNDLKKAKQHYLKALSHSNQKQAILGLYNSYKKENQLKEVIPYLLKWLKAHPNDLLVEISLADSYKASNQLQKSADVYQQMIDKNGKLPVLYNNAANVYFTLGEKEKSLEYAQQAYKVLPENVAIIDTLAWINSRLGNYKEALALFRQALIIDFDNAEVKYHLAVTLFALKRKVEAKKHLIESIESKQIFSDKDEAEKLLATWQ